MSNYRRGAVFGLTVAEMFILLTFLLLFALLGLIRSEESDLHAEESNQHEKVEASPRVWVQPEEIETLVHAAEDAREALKKAESARVTAEDLLEHARNNAEKAEREAELKYASIEHERDLAHKTAEEARKALEKAELARIIAEVELDQARRSVEESHIAHKEVELERDQARRDLNLLRHKGENPPCWYEVVDTGGGQKRERRLYAFKVAIYEIGIELGQLTPPPGGAFDDSDQTYEEEWVQLQIRELPYGERLTDSEFEEVVRDLHNKGMSRQVRSYECVFSVRVWDETPDHAKERWQYAHDELIEQYFNAYTMKNDKWEEFQ